MNDFQLSLLLFMTFQNSMTNTNATKPYNLGCLYGICMSSYFLLMLSIGSLGVPHQIWEQKWVFVLWV